MVPEAVLSSAQSCGAGLYTLGFDFSVESSFRPFAFFAMMTDETLALESDAALGDHDAGQASVGTQWVCRSSWGFCVGSRCVWGQAFVRWSGVGWGAVS